MDSSDSECDFGFDLIGKCLKNDHFQLDYSDSSDVNSDSSDEGSDTYEDLGDDDDSADSHNQVTWSATLQNVDVMDFNDIPGPTTPLPATAREIDYFNLIFPEELFESIADETNRYAEIEEARRETNGTEWQATWAEEIRAYVAIHMMTRIGLAPRHLYLHLFKGYSLFEKMSCDRFFKLSKYLRVADTSSNPQKYRSGHDRLAHVRPIINAIMEKSKANYVPHREVTIDEAIIAYTGRMRFRKYCPLTSTARGFKVWLLTDPHNGYVNNFKVYTGPVERDPSKSLAVRVVKDLTRDLWGKYRHVYCKHQLTSIELFQDLLANNTYACGPIHTGQNVIPPALRKFKLKKPGDAVQRQNGNLVMSAWRNWRTVKMMLSTNADPLESINVYRKQKDGQMMSVDCPKVFELYSLYKNGAYKADRLLSIDGECGKKTKWWKHIFWFLLDVAVCNAFILMKQSANHQNETETGETRNLTLKEFRKNLGNQLFGNYRDERIGGLHWPRVFPEKRPCKHCAAKNIHK